MISFKAMQELKLLQPSLEAVTSHDMSFSANDKKSEEMRPKTVLYSTRSYANDNIPLTDGSQRSYLQIRDREDAKEVCYVVASYLMERYSLIHSLQVYACH